MLVTSSKFLKYQQVSYANPKVPFINKSDDQALVETDGSLATAPLPKRKLRSGEREIISSIEDDGKFKTVIVDGHFITDSTTRETLIFALQPHLDVNLQTAIIQEVIQQGQGQGQKQFPDIAIIENFPLDMSTFYYRDTQDAVFTDEQIDQLQEACNLIIKIRNETLLTEKEEDSEDDQTITQLKDKIRKQRVKELTFKLLKPKKRKATTPPTTSATPPKKPTPTKPLPFPTTAGSSLRISLRI